MQQCPSEVLARQIPKPEEDQRRGNNPVSQHRRKHRFERGHRRTRFPLPPEVSAHQPHQVPGAVFLERLSIRKNGGEPRHASPHPQQPKMKSPGKRHKNTRATERKSTPRKSIPPSQQTQP